MERHASAVRKRLTLHGRSTTLDCCNPIETSRALKIKCVKLQECNIAFKESLAKKQLTAKDVISGDGDIASFEIVENVPVSRSVPEIRPIKLSKDERLLAVNPPLSKETPEQRKDQGSIADPRGSYSFYGRPFKVRGQRAWEYAMRDLGSVDTLNNRYGWMPEKFRKMER